MTEPLPPERLAEIRELVFGVQHFTTPWQLLPEPTADGYWQVHYATDNPLAGLAVLVPDYGWDIARFVEESVTFVPELLAELDRVRAERDELKAITVNARQLSGHWSRQSSAALFGSQVARTRTGRGCAWAGPTRPATAPTSCVTCSMARPPTRFRHGATARPRRWVRCSSPS
ncbi:hypothetical protein ACFXI8_27085 [Streptomyces niveus]|uniref:hypothetical protein n=1 Tax=Streptomyces niveus TaxID=193462 RepID=UPI003690BC77